MNSVIIAIYVLILLVSVTFIYKHTTKGITACRDAGPNPKSRLGVRALHLLILLSSAALLCNQLAKSIPTRLRADQAPISEFGIVPVDGFGSRSDANGVE
jgi:hypothetical protein